MELPLFPLHVVLFPGRPLPLHVFELRYRLLLDHCLATDRALGVVAIRNGRETGAVPDTYRVGTVAHIEAVERMPDGRANIATRGTKRFRIEHMLEGTDYPTAEVTLLEDRPAGPEELACAQQLRRLLLPYLARLGAPRELLQCLPREPEQLAYLAAAAVQIEVPRQQRLLELDATGQRIAATLELLRQEAGLVRHLGAVGSLRPPGPGGAELN